MTIRRATLDDLTAMREICLLTGDEGSDATGRWSDDGLIPDIYLEPYVRYPDGLAWVVDEGDGPVGYLVAVADTEAFARWWRAEWVPEFVDRHGRATEREGEGWLYDAGTRPDLLIAGAPMAEFPAHLHIDLLPEAQGRGSGRTLMRALGEELVALGVPGVQLGVGDSNTGAVAFYERLGFTRWGADPDPDPDGAGSILVSSSERLAAV